jgi:hypothetical protein
MDAMRMPPARTIAVAALLWALVLSPMAWGSLPSTAPAEPTGRVRGEVVDRDTGRPVPGANVTLPGYGVRTSSGPDGRFSFAEPLPSRHPSRLIEARVSAPGRGRWTVTGLPLIPGEILQLHAELRSSAWSHRVAVREQPRDHPRGAPDGLTGKTCTGWPYQLVPPQTIRVRITEEGLSQEYDFAFYLTHVLPSEWIPSWDGDALGAGAIAVKTYAAYRTLPGNAYSEGEGCADILDSVADQVFDPTYSYATTDLAVYATMGSVLYRSGGLFLSQYYAGSPGQACAPVEGQYAGRMAQWGTQTCALGGMGWPEVTTTFYGGTSWNYLRNLMLNPSVSSPATYPFTASGNTTWARTAGAGHDGGWFLTESPKIPGTTATLWQQRPFSGTATTPYHASVAVRCGPENLTDCGVTVRVVAFPVGAKPVTRGVTVTVPATGTWQVVNFDPAPFGVAHPSVRLSVVTSSTISADAFTLTAPFGGP